MEIMRTDVLLRSFAFGLAARAISGGLCGAAYVGLSPAGCVIRSSHG
jgi:hypothetical protein